MSESDLEQWYRRLAQVPYVSERFRSRHARLLTRLAHDADRRDVTKALAVAFSDPRHAARILLQVADEPEQVRRRVVHVTCQGPLAEELRPWLMDQDLDALLTLHPPLQRTRVPLHPDRRATLVPSSPIGPLVAVAWSPDSVDTRNSNRSWVDRDVLTRYEAADDNSLPVVAVNDYAIARMSSGPSWVLSPDYGITVEDELRAGQVSSLDREMLVRSLATLRAAMLDTGVIWQGFAPRNMFRRDGQLVLIDFERCADVQHEPVRSAEYLVWHRVFFADCLTLDEQRIVFSRHTREPGVKDATSLSADQFEYALLGRSTVTWGERRGLLQQSAALEGRYNRATTQRDSGILFGHELGHFWGDFVSVDVEAVIFRQLLACRDDDERVACLEAFEAAMEADIDTLLLADALREPSRSAERTRALAEAIEAFGREAVAAVRVQTCDWYPRLEADAIGLTDAVLADLHTADIAEVAGEYLVGRSEYRDRHAERLRRSVELGIGFTHGDGCEDRFLNHADPASLLKQVAAPVPWKGTDFESVLAEVDDQIVRCSISQAHPGYLAFPDSGNAVASLAGSMLTRLLNQNVIAVDRSAPAATFVTIQVIEWLRELVGYAAMPLSDFRGVKDVAGLWTTGGHMSNHIAMLTALGERFPQVRQQGIARLETRPAVIMAGPIAHYSHSDAAFHLGLGWDSVLQLPARSDYTSDPEAIDAMLSEPPSGVTPFMVIGVAGNCRTTGLDDLHAIGEVCKRHGVWFHADACHGGSLIFTDRLKRQHLGGIDQADSTSLDPHKGLFTPYPSSYVLFRRRGVLNQFSRHAATVNEDGCWDLGLITPFFGSVGFEALPTWMLLKHLGVRGLARLVESRQSLVRHLQRVLDDSGLFIRLNDVDFYRLAWVFCPPPIRVAIRQARDDHTRGRLRQLISAYISRINELLYREGRVCFDEHTLGDLDDRVELGTEGKYTIMASCPGNPLATMHDIDHAAGELVRTARTMIAPMLAAVDTNFDESPRRIAGPAGWNDE